jgi:hypothetical protein
MVNVYVPAAVGVPPIFPVELFSVRPGGSEEPAATENVYGAVPPVADSVDE